MGRPNEPVRARNGVPADLRGLLAVRKRVSATSRRLPTPSERYAGGGGVPRPPTRMWHRPRVGRIHNVTCRSGRGRGCDSLRGGLAARVYTQAHLGRTFLFWQVLLGSTHGPLMRRATARTR